MHHVCAVKGASSDLANTTIECTAIMSPLVNAGIELNGLKPHVLVVTMGTLTPSERSWSIMLALKRFSRSFRKSLDGPCSQERHVRSFANPL